MYACSARGDGLGVTGWCWVCSDCSEGQPGPGLRAADARELDIAHRA